MTATPASASVRRPPNAGGPVVVAAVEVLSPTLRRLRLVPEDEAPLPAAAPGAHVVVTIGQGPEERRNAYSLIASPDIAGGYEIVVRLDPASHGGSAALYALPIGGRLTVGPPRSFFAPVARAGRHLMLAGGVGITPFLAYARTLAPAGADWFLHHVGRAGEQAALAALLPAAAAERVRFHAGRAGLDLDGVLADQPLATHLYLCGPPAFIDVVAARALALGWPAAKVHAERFTAAGGEPFEVVLARTGRRLPVPGHRTLLEVLEAAGERVPYLCRGGVCGECRVGVRSGRPAHCDRVLDAEERERGDVMLACCSRAATPVLELDL